MPLLAWLVHAYTAVGAVLAFLAIEAVAAGRLRAAFAWLFLAAVVDASDGWLARRARVKERTPSFDGRKLDDLVDYLTFVFVPAFLMHRAGLFPEDWSLVLASVVLLSSGYGFSHEQAKTSDHFFTGFPSYWNIVAFYLYAGGTPPTLNAAIVAGLAILVFVPVRCVYPSRTPALRWLTVAACIVWSAVILWMIAELPDVRRDVLAASLTFPLYYVVLSLVLTARRRAEGWGRV